MKKHLTLSNLIFLVAAAYLILVSLPVVLNNFAKTGKQIETREHLVIERSNTNKKIAFPSKGRTIALFWATWCAPCKLEMARLENSIRKGKIPSGAIVAINPFESTDTIRRFLKETSYPFTFIEDDGLSRVLEINTTPTTLFLEGNKVMALSSGVSFIGIWRAESFLGNR